MALILEANYSKKIGLPGYSSHQFSITLKTEIADPAQAQVESARLYTLLQSAVDQSLQQVGWLPQKENAPDHRHQTNGNGNGHDRVHENGTTNGSNHGNGNGSEARWTCSEKQRDLIERIVQENSLDKKEIEELALDRFGKGVRQLNKLEASGLIDELFERHGGRNGNGHQRRGGFQRRNANAR